MQLKNEKSVLAYF